MLTFNQIRSFSGKSSTTVALTVDGCDATLTVRGTSEDMLSLIAVSEKVSLKSERIDDRTQKTKKENYEIVKRTEFVAAFAEDCGCDVPAESELKPKAKKASK